MMIKSTSFGCLVKHAKQVKHISFDDAYTIHYTLHYTLYTIHYTLVY